MSGNGGILESLKKKIQEYSDPTNQVAYMRGVVDTAVYLAGKEGEEVPSEVKDLQKILDLMTGLIK
jgi:hypothetical protein